jgi:hypothetical protein
MRPTRGVPQSGDVFGGDAAIWQRFGADVTLPKIPLAENE